VKTFDFMRLLGNLWSTGRAWWLVRPERVSKHAKGRRRPLRWREKRKKRQMITQASRRRNRGR